MNMWLIFLNGRHFRINLITQILISYKEGAVTLRDILYVGRMVRGGQYTMY